MALNFPPVDAGDDNPIDGQIWTAATGKQWIYRSNIPGWQALAPTGNSNIVYRGGIDLTQSPDSQYSDIVSGNQFAVTVGDDPVNGSLYPGLGGQRVLNGFVMYDGNEWQALTEVPYATEVTPGVVELASANEALDETNHRAVLTPKRGDELIDDKIKQATTTRVGKTRYATRNETEAGTEDQAALTPYSIKNILDKLEQLEYNIVDTGLVMWMAGPRQYVPSGWMHCDGRRIYNNGETAELYKKLKAWDNPWGNGPSSDVVRIPDLRGRFIRGNNDGSGRDPANTQFGGSQDDEFKLHGHAADVKDPGHIHAISGNGYNQSVNAPQADAIVDNNLGVVKNTSTNNSKTGISVDVKGFGGKETRPKNINLTPVIKL